MQLYEVLDLVISLISVILSFIAIKFTYSNLKEIKNQNFETNRGNIIMYTDYNDGQFINFHIANLGKSPAMLKAITTDPVLSWKDNIKINSKMFDITKIKDMLLVPSQSITVSYEADKLSRKLLSVTINFNTMGKDQKNEYNIDLQSMDNIICFDYQKPIAVSLVDIADQLRMMNIHC